MGEMADYYLDSIDFWEEDDEDWFDDYQRGSYRMSAHEYHREMVRQAIKHPLYKDILRLKKKGEL